MYVVVSCVAPLTVHIVRHSISWVELCRTAHGASCVSQHVLGLTYFTPFIVNRVPHSMYIVWVMLHYSLCIMHLTAWPWFELCCTTHCATCTSQHDLGLSYVALLTVHHAPHSMTLVWVMLHHSLCIMCVSPYPKNFLPFFSTLWPPGHKILLLSHRCYTSNWNIYFSL
jgi:hypothetical protein